MNDSDGFLKVKRGRPKKISEHIKRNLVVNSIESNHVMSRHISDLQINYINENFNQRLRNMILRVPILVKLPNQILKLQLQKILEDCVKELMISELELIGFTIVLERIIINSLSIPIEEFLKLCFFISKNVFESNKDILHFIKSRLSRQFKNFDKNFIQLSQGMSFSIIDINKRYRKFEKIIYSDINYSYYVDSIIRVSPPYNVTGKKLLDNDAKSNKNIFIIRKRQKKFEIDDQLSSDKCNGEEIKDDQDSSLDYYNLRPLDDNDLYLKYTDSIIHKTTKDPLDFLNDEIPDVFGDDDSEIVLDLD